jgi:colanic acid/amylovoran biosynthesis protein
MRILITNMYTHRNKGDAAILFSLISETKRVFGEKTKTVVQTADPAGDAGKFGTKTTSTLLWILLSSVRKASVLRRVLRLTIGTTTLMLYLLIYVLLKRKASFLLSAQLRQYVKDMHEADIVIATGGGYLNTSDASIHETVLLLITVLNFVSGSYLAKPVYVYSVSIGPLYSKLQRLILRFALNRVNLVEAREDLSLEFVKKLNIKTPSILTADAALLLGSRSMESTKIQTRAAQLSVGLTVRKWFKSKNDLNNYLQVIATTVDYIIEKHNAAIYCLPQVIADNFDDDDRLMAKNVRNLSKHPERIHLVEDDLHPFEIIGVCRKLDFLIGTRMHSTIFSLVNNVPVIGIACEHKTTGLLRGLGLEELSIDAKAVTAQNLQKKVDLLIQNRPVIANRIAKHMEGQIDRGERAMEAIKEAYAARTAKAGPTGAQSRDGGGVSDDTTDPYTHRRNGRAAGEGGV